MDYQELKYEVSGKIAVITLHRPERMNAFTHRMGMEITDALLRADDDDSVRAVIFTGAGKAFCAGADLSAGNRIFRDFSNISEAEKNWEKDMERKIQDRAIVQTSPAGKPGELGGGPIHTLMAMKKPVIAAINGPAVGFGIAFTLAMDFRFAAESAKIGFVFVRRGVTPESLSPWLLPKIIGLNRALDLLLTGRTIKAPEALEMGLVSKVFPDGQVLDKAMEFAGEMIANSGPVALALTRRMIWQFLLEDDPIKVERNNHTYFFWSTASRDCIEGIQAFLEKRKPDWKMSLKKDLPDFFPL